MATSLRLWYAWLLGPLLLAGACQRATYSFQAPAPAYSPMATPMVQAATHPPDLLVLAAPAVQRRPARLRPRAVVRTKQPLPPARLAWLVARHLPGLVRRPAAAVAPAQADPPGPTRSRGVAVLLAAIPTLLGLPLGLHNFYLGYAGRGIATILLAAASIALILVGAVGFFFGLFAGVTSGQLVLFIIGTVIYYGLYIWQLVDVVRIICRTLLPRNGVYKPSFF